MNQKDVISLGEKIVMEDVGIFSGFWSWTVAGFIVLFFVGVIVTLIGIETNLLVLLFGAVVAFFSFFAALSYTFEPYGKAHEKYEQEVLDWKKNVAIPYIDSLPYEKNEIVDIKIEAEATEKVNGHFYHGYGSISSETKHFTPITVTYKDNQFITETFWHKKTMSFTNEEKPFMRYKKLNKNLGHDINAGNYHTEVFLPENYEFTKIN